MLPNEYSVTLNLVDPSTVRARWGAVDEVFPLDRLFDRTPNETQLLANLRFAMRINGTPDPTSALLRDWINSRGGIQTRERRFFVSAIRQSPTDPNAYTLTYGVTTDDQSYGIGLTAETLADSPTDPAIVLDNVVAFLRIGGFNELTPQAIAAVAAHPFRGF